MSSSTCSTTTTYNAYGTTTGYHTFQSSAGALIGLLGLSAILSFVTLLMLATQIRRVRVAAVAAASGVAPIFTGVAAWRIQPWSALYVHIFASLFGAIGWVQYLVNVINWTSANYETLLEPNRSYSTGWFLMLAGMLVYIASNICIRIGRRGACARCRHHGRSGCCLVQRRSSRYSSCLRERTGRHDAARVRRREWVWRTAELRRHAHRLRHRAAGYRAHRARCAHLRSVGRLQ